MDRRWLKLRNISTTSPGDFASDLRMRIFRTQGEAAEYLALDRSTIGRYESDRITPPIGYLAFLLVHYLNFRMELSLKPELGEEAQIDPQIIQNELSSSLNELIDSFPGRYRGVRRLRNWQQLEEIADEFMQQRRISIELSTSEVNDLVANDTLKENDKYSKRLDASTHASNATHFPRARSIIRPYLAISILLLASSLLAILIGINLGQNIADTRTLTPTASTTSVCSEQGRREAPDAFRFLRSQGVINFVADTSDGAILSNMVRSLTIDERGLWIGYVAEGGKALNGIGQRDKYGWVDCSVPRTNSVASNNINDLAIDRKHRIWAATEDGGVLMFDGSHWNRFTTASGLPTTNTLGITIDTNDNVWAATWEGIAKFNGETWTVPFKVGQGTIFNNHTHSIAFQDNGDIWVAHVGQGVSHYSNRDGRWIHHTVDKGELGSNDIFSIAIRKGDSAGAESVWFATGDGVSTYEDGGWTTYHTDDGLPDDSTKAVALDKYNRVWAATAGGVAYLDTKGWVLYHNIPALSIVFGSSCSDCPYDDDHVWTGTESAGLTHSRLPLPINVQPLDVISVRYRDQDNPDDPFRDEIVVAPGERFLAEITISPRSPYTLTAQRGDLLINLEEEDRRFGAYPQMGVKGTVESGQRYTFTDYDNPFIAPPLPDGIQEQKFSIRYRVWMHTRYVGPIIEISFTVRRAPASSIAFSKSA